MYGVYTAVTCVLFSHRYRKEGIHVFCCRLRNIVIRRYSVPTHESDAVRAANALRSLAPAERTMLEQAFSAMDTDYSGSLSITEISELFRDIYGITAPPAQGEDSDDELYLETQIDTRAPEAQSDSDGALQDAMDVSGRPIESTTTSTPLESLTAKDWFALFDSDGSGEVTLDEFLFGVRCTPQLCEVSLFLRYKQIFNQFDADSSNTVDAWELKEMVTQLIGGDEENQLQHEAELATVIEDFQTVLADNSISDTGEVSWSEFLRVMRSRSQLDHTETKREEERALDPN